MIAGQHLSVPYLSRSAVRSKERPTKEIACCSVGLPVISVLVALSKGGRAASRPCEGSQPSVRGAGLLAGRAVKGVS